MMRFVRQETNMPKLKNVTAEELAVSIDEVQTASGNAGELLNRISQGYGDKFPEPLAAASSFLAASRTLADLAQSLLMKGALQEQERAMEERLRKRVAG
jgi:hypothetical protein